MEAERWACGQMVNASYFMLLHYIVLANGGFFADPPEMKVKN